MGIERTFVMVKPDHFRYAYSILGKVDSVGERFDEAIVYGVPREVIEEHYAEHMGKSFFGHMCDSFVGRNVQIAVYQGEGVVQRVRELCGHTDPAKAAPSTIRKMYGDDSLDRAIEEKRPVRNVIHSSDGIESAQREIQVWLRYLDRIRNGKL